MTARGPREKNLAEPGYFCQVSAPAFGGGGGESESRLDVLQASKQATSKYFQIDNDVRSTEPSTRQLLRIKMGICKLIRE